MKGSLAATVLVLGCTLLDAQVQAGGSAVTPGGATNASAPVSASKQAAAPVTPTTTTQVPKVERSDIGFSYSLPPDWEFVAPAPAPRVETPYPTAIPPKKGAACVEVAFTARHGTPASVIVVLALPFACYGQAMTASDLENFGAGAAEWFAAGAQIVGGCCRTRPAHIREVARAARGL